jgi:hypothetical protein
VPICPFTPSPLHLFTLTPIHPFTFSPSPLHQLVKTPGASGYFTNSKKEELVVHLWKILIIVSIKGYIHPHKLTGMFFA